MKYLCILLVIAIGAALSPTVTAFESGGGGSGSSAGAGGAQSGGAPVGNTEKVMPGEEHGNNDTCVANQNRSGNKCISVTPALGGPSSETDIRVDSHVECAITGVDGNDEVHLGGDVTADITCSGGTINMAGGGTTLTLRVTSVTGAEHARVNLLSGATLWVAPGSTVVFAP